MAEETRTVLIGGYQARPRTATATDRGYQPVKPASSTAVPPRLPKTVSVVNPPKPGQK